MTEENRDYCPSLYCSHYVPCPVHKKDLYVTLNTGAKMPMLGLGTYQSEPGVVGKCIEHGLKAGYRHIDCAEVYGNQKEIGQAFARIFSDPDSGVKREDVFVTSKLWLTDYHPNDVRPALEKSLRDLQLTYLDLYLIHIPVPCERVNGKERARRRAGFSLHDTWKVLEACHKEGKIRSIGVSNFPVVLLNDFQNAAEIVPAVNQIERHPYLSQQELLAWQNSIGVSVTAYAPLGAPAEMGAVFDKAKVCPLLKNPTIVGIANRHRKTPAQVLIRWNIDSGCVVIPKSSNPARIVENFDVWDFNLSPSDMDDIAKLNCNFRTFTQDEEGVPMFK